MAVKNEKDRTSGDIRAGEKEIVMKGCEEKLQERRKGESGQTDK